MRGGGWTGDLLIADWEEIENATHRSDINFKRLKAEDVDLPKLNGNPIFPSAQGNLTLYGDISYRKE